MDCVCFIFARGGSKGIKEKNLQRIGDATLVEHSVQLALTLPQISEVVVSTDDEKIADVARFAGASVPFMRPKELSADGSPEWMAWRHAIEWYQSNRSNFDLFLSLPPTSPLRSYEDVDRCFNELHSNPATDIIVTVTEAHRHPSFNMVSIDNEGLTRLYDSGDQTVSRRQDVHPVFDLTTVAYLAKPEFILSGNRIFDGAVRSVVVPRERAIDIDTPLDLVLARAIYDGNFGHKNEPN